MGPMGAGLRIAAVVLGLSAASLVQSPAFAGDDGFWPWTWILKDWHRLWMGIPFSACLLGILTAHEFGHYIYCVRRGVYARAGVLAATYGYEGNAGELAACD